MLPKGATTLVGGPLRLTLATLNLDNLTVSDAQAKFDGFASIIVNNLASPSIICADEMQDDNGPVNDNVVTSDVTLNRLVSAISVAGGPAYSSRYINPLDDQDGGGPGANLVTAGNFNDFEFSAPLAALETAPLANLVKTLPANDRYTLNFDGNSQAFHHIFVSQHLISTSRIEAIHNSSEYIASDRFTAYDPLVASILTGLPADFAQWQNFYFRSQDLIAGASFTGFAGDPDADGMVNGLEAALGTDPQSRSSGNAGPLSSAFLGTGSGQRLVMDFDMPSTALSDLTIDAEESPSLATGSWSTIATKVGTAAWSGPAIVTVATLSAERIRVQVQSLQNPSAGKTFLRLKVRQ